MSRGAGAAWGTRDTRPAGVAAGLFLLFSLVRYGPTAVVTGSRWHEWYDQGRYYASTIAFAHGDLSAASHWYPLVYSLVSVPALLIVPYNPYLLVDALCFAVIAACVVRVGCLFDIRPRIALILFLATTLFHPQLQNAWLEPWTSTLSCAWIWILIARTGAIFAATDSAAPRRRDVAILGAVSALILLTRPADAIIALVIAAGLVARLAARRSLQPRIIGAGVLGAALPLAGYALLHLAIYGLRSSDYMRGSADIGLSFGDLGWKATVLFVDPRPWFPEGDGMLRVMPWLPFGLAGGIGLTLCARFPLRGYVALLLAAVLVYAITLTAYVDLLPPGLWHFGNIHYFKWIFPLLALFGWAGLREARWAPRTNLAVLAAIFAVTGLRYDAVPAGPSEPTRRLDFAAPAPAGDGDHWADIYFAKSVITDGTRVRQNILGYRQIPDGRVMRAIALRRDFDAPVALYGAGLPGPANGGGREAVSARAPIKRWKTRLGWGVPCWIFACPDRR